MQMCWASLEMPCSLACQRLRMRQWFSRMSLNGPSLSTKMLMVSQQTNSIFYLDYLPIYCPDIATIQLFSRQPLAMRQWKYRLMPISCSYIYTFPKRSQAAISSSTSPSVQLFLSNFSAKCLAQRYLVFARKMRVTFLQSCSSSCFQKRKQLSQRSQKHLKVRSKQYRLREQLPYQQKQNAENAKARQIRLLDPKVFTISCSCYIFSQTDLQEYTSSFIAYDSLKTFLRGSAMSLPQERARCLRSSTVISDAKSDDCNFASLLMLGMAVLLSLRKRVDCPSVRLVDILMVAREGWSMMRFLRSAKGSLAIFSRLVVDSMNWLILKVGHLKSLPQVSLLDRLIFILEGLQASQIMPQSFLLLLLGDDLPDLGELHELVDGLEGNSCVVFQLLVVDHFVHVVGRNRADDVLVLLVVPHLSVLVQGALVDLVKVSEGSRLVILLLLLGQRLVLVLGLADEEDLLLLIFGRGLLFVVGSWLDVEIIGIVEVFGQVFRLLGFL